MSTLAVRMTFTYLVYIAKFCGQNVHQLKNQEVATDDQCSLCILWLLFYAYQWFQHLSLSSVVSMHAYAQKFLKRWGYFHVIRKKKIDHKYARANNQMPYPLRGEDQENNLSSDYWLV